MRSRFVRAALVVVLFACIACVTVVGTHMQDLEKTKETEETEDEIIVISLEVSPEIRVARMTYDVKTDRNKEELEEPQAFTPVGMFGLYEVSEITPIEGGYRMVCQGIYDDTVDELEKKRDFRYYGHSGKKQIMDDSRVHSSQMEITVVGARHFDAVDVNGFSLPVDISPLGVCILPEQEWQEDARRAYVIADLKDGTSRLITKLPTVNPLGKKYRAAPPQEIQKLEEEENQMENLFIEWGSAAETENCGLRLASENDIDVELIENVRLIVQELE